MCGIFCKFFNVDENTDTFDFLTSFDKISHRGPDGEGVFYITRDSEKYHRVNSGGSLRKEVKKEYYSTAIAHKRLSIIDLSDVGIQPFIEDGLVLAFNGEIFNYRELRKELIEKGVIFVTETDTEVVLKSYIEWGKGCSSRFNGMWAIAIYDINNKSVVLTRDRFGIKPLYYQFNNGLVVSSEIKPLSVRKVNMSSLSSFLEYNIVDHNLETLFDGVFQVEPSTIYEFDSSLNISKERYFDIASELSNSDIEKDYGALIENSVELRNHADVDIGGLLSGGIDSSIIAALTKKVSGQFEGFSSVFDDERFSEEKYIRETQSYLGINVKYNKPVVDSLHENVCRQVYIQDSPLRSLAPVYQNQLYSTIRENSKIRVVLNGQGADEIFSGYHEHIMCNFYDLLKNFEFGELYHQFSSYANIRGVSSIKLASQMGAFFVQERLPKLWHRAKPRLLTTTCTRKPAPIDLSNRLLYNVFISALPEYLKYEDRNSMANGIEARLPFLDYRLVIAAVKLSNSERIVGGVAKQHLRNFAADLCLVSPNVLNRKDKTGFVSPQHTYMKENMKQDILVQLDYWLSLSSSIVNKKYIEDIRSRFALGRNVDLNKVFRLYTAAIWLKEFKLVLDE